MSREPPGDRPASEGDATSGDAGGRRRSPGGAGERARSTGGGGERTRSTSDGDEYTLDVPEMDCPSCAGTVESALSGVEGLEAFDVRPTTGTVVVESAAADRAVVVDAVEAVGYEVVAVDGEPAGDREVVRQRPPVWTSSRAKKTALSGVLLGLGLAVAWLPLGLDGRVGALLGNPLLLSHVLLLAGAAVGGEVILRNGYYSARALSLDIDFLMSAAILAAVGVSLVTGETLYVEAASLAFLFNVAELLERHSVDRARSSLRELMELSPDTARVRRGGRPVEVPADEVRVGEVVLVQPGEKIPVDGAVTTGESAVDQSPITGESVPVEKAAGDEVFAGTVNEAGYLEVEATAEADETTLARIVALVEDAEAGKTDRERFVERFAGYYTPAVVAVAVLSATVPPLVLGWPWLEWFVNGIAFLVIACPCAFVISTPVSVVSAVTSAARNGVLIKGGDRLEAMGEVDAVAVDKTGTLTAGELEVTDVVPLGDADERELLATAAGLERRSEHPIAAAVLAAADDAGVEAPTVSSFEALAGRGVRAELDGVTHYAGKPGLFAELGFDLDGAPPADGPRSTDGGPRPPDDGPPSTDGGESVADRGETASPGELLARLEAEGKTVVLVGTDDALLGVVAIADEPRQGARRAVERLRELGVEAVVMLTGDNEGTARAVAERVGVDEFRAELLPEGKVDAVEALQAEHGTVAMVGDGINDAPALAAADVGVAMGAAGTDTAIETADVALMGDDLAKLPYCYELSDEANGVIRQNVWGSLAAKALLAVGIPLGYVSVVLAVLAGDVGMTVLVTANAMRLSRIVPEHFTAAE